MEGWRKEEGREEEKYEWFGGEEEEKAGMGVL